MRKFLKSQIFIFVVIILLSLTNLAYAQPLEMERIEFNTKDETELLSIEAESVVVFYEPGYETLATQVSQYLSMAKSTLKSRLGFEPIKWRVAIYEKGISILTPPQNGKPYWLGTAIVNEGVGSCFFNQVQWWTRATIAKKIHLASNDAYWFTYGLAYYFSWVCARSISKDSQDKTGLVSYLRSELASFRNYLQSQPDSNFCFDLSKWTPILERIVKDYNLLGEIKSPTDTIQIKKVLEDIKEDRHNCQLAAFFWLKIEGIYGKSVISKFILNASKLKEPTGEELVKILSKITGRNINKMLTMFTVYDVMTTINKFEKEPVLK